MKSEDDRRDVIVVGAGPAGSTIAGLLAKDGFDVLLLERETFPRFHIGESLLPAEIPVFEALGFNPEPLPSLYKAGATFIDETTHEKGVFPFAEGLPGTRPHAWQVNRASFDKALADHASELGAEVRFATRVQSADWDQNEARVTLANGQTERARYLVDATGRDRLLCKQQKSFERISGLGLAAVWAHFDGLSQAAQDELYSDGNIIVLMIDQGWGWLIPLAGGRLSVGFVSAKQGVVSEDWFQRCVDSSPLLQRVTEGAEMSEVVMAGDYSFKNTKPSGSRYACIGDARAFLDPVFSSGVAFAMASALQLHEELSPALREGREDEPELAAPVAKKMQHAYDVFGATIYSFYHTHLVRNVFFYDDPDPELRAGFISVLAGDLWRDDNKFQKMMLRSRRRREGRRSTSAGAA